MDPIKLPEQLAEKVGELQEQYKSETEKLQEEYQEKLNALTGKYQAPLNWVLMGFLADKGVDDDQNYYIENGMVHFVDKDKGDNLVEMVDNGKVATQ